jgi:hypothetical protein
MNLVAIGFAGGERDLVIFVTSHWLVATTQAGIGVGYEGRVDGRAFHEE